MWDSDLDIEDHGFDPKKTVSAIRENSLSCLPTQESPHREQQSNHFTENNLVGSLVPLAEFSQKTNAGRDKFTQRCDEEDKRHNIDALPVFGAIAETTRLIVISGKVQKLFLNVKSSKTSTDPQESTLFYIKISSSQLQNIEDFLKDGTMVSLSNLLRSMQTTEEESHLCIQFIDPDDPTNVLQKNFILDTSNNDSLDHPALRCIQSAIRRKRKQENWRMHLRVYQRSKHMMEECQKVYIFFQQLRIFHPEVKLEFSLRIGESVSSSDFRYTSSMQKAMSLEMVTDADYFLQEAALTSSRDVYVEHEQSESSSLSMFGGEVSLNLTCITAFIKTGCQDEMNAENDASYITGTFFGPEWAPLALEQQASCVFDDWPLEDLGLEKKCSSRRQGFIGSHSQLTVKQTVSCNSTTFFAPIFFMLASDKYCTIQDKFRFCSWLESSCSVWLPVIKPELLRLANSALQKHFKTLKNVQKAQKIIKKSIESVGKAIFNIVTQSSNDEFRRNCFSHMQVASARDLQTKVVERLFDISKVKHNCGPIDFNHQTQQSQASTADSQCTQETQDVTDSSQNLEECSGLAEQGDATPHHKLLHSETFYDLDNEAGMESVDTDLCDNDVLKMCTDDSTEACSDLVAETCTNDLNWTLASNEEIPTQINAIPESNTFLPSQIDVTELDFGNMLIDESLSAGGHRGTIESESHTGEVFNPYKSSQRKIHKLQDTSEAGSDDWFSEVLMDVQDWLNET